MQSARDCKRAKSNGRRAPGSALLGLVALAAVLLPVWAAPAAAAGTGAAHRDTVGFGLSDLRFGRVGGRDLVSLVDGAWLGRPGEPRLPVRPYRVALPPGARVVSVSVAAADSVLVPGVFDIPPARAPRPVSAVPGGLGAAPGDSVGTAGGFYPASFGEYLGAGCMDGLPIADIMLYPVRYDRAAGRLMLATRLVVAVEYAIDGRIAARAAGPVSGMFEGLVSSSAAHRPACERKVLDAPYASLAEGEAEYVIIADSSLAACFQPLIDWKMRKGVPAALVTLDEIDAAYAGADLQERIRNCIADYHSAHGTRWVLLGGDAGFIPERRLYVQLSDKPWIPSDLYYADLDGTWNDDGDLRWGEVPADGVDMYADVYLGRAPVNTPAEAAVFVDKVLAYEGAYGPVGDHVEDMLFLGEILWGDVDDPSDPDYTDGGEAKDMVEAAYVPGDFEVLKLYESLYNLTQAATVAALEEGRGMVNVNCHGGVTGISLGEESLPASRLLELTSAPAYGLMYATSCLVAAFDQSSFGEAWVRSPAGGGFFIGNSRYGWGIPGDPGGGPSDRYDQAFFEAVFTTGLLNLGKAHTYAKHEYVAESRYDSYYRYVMYGLNLLGDPETPLWTEAPAEVTVEHPAVAVCGPGEFQVAVRSGGAPASGLTVCLYKSGDVYMVGETDALGTVTFEIEPSEPGTLLVTVTGANHLPHLGSAVVESAETGVSGGTDSPPLSLAVGPNPFHSKVTLAVAAAPGAEVTAEIYDIRGRRVAGLSAAASAGGAAELTWDGLDPHGRRVSPGVYVVRVSAGSEAVTRKALMMR